MGLGNISFEKTELKRFKMNINGARIGSASHACCISQLNVSANQFTIDLMENIEVF